MTATHLDSPVAPQTEAHSASTSEASNRLSQEANTGSTSNSQLKGGVLGDTEKIGQVTWDGIKSTPKGILNAAENEITHPGDLIKTVLGSAAVGAVLKTVLPEAGPVGKIAGLAMGAWFVGSSMPGFIHSYSDGLDAKTDAQIKNAGQEWGNTVGQLGVNSVLGFGGYKIGAGAADSILSRESMDGFADSKQNAWNAISDKVKSWTPDTVASTLHIDKSVPTAVSLGMQPHYVSTADGSGAKLMDSAKTDPKDNPQTEDLGKVPDNQPMAVDLMLNRKSSILAQDRYNARISKGQAVHLTDDDGAFEKRFGAAPDSLAAVQDFADKNHLHITSSDLRSGSVTLSGQAADFQTAFKTELKNYRLNGTDFQGRAGVLTLPDELTAHVRAVHGTDTRPVAAPTSRVRGIYSPDGQSDLAGHGGGKGSGDGAGKGDGGPQVPLEPIAQPRGYLATQIAQAQHFPMSTGGEGQSGAFISFGGGIDTADYSKFFPAHGLESPKPLNITTINGAENSFGDPQGADGENSLDGIQMQSIAPKANVSMILGNNDDQSLVGVYRRGVFPENGEKQNSVVSSSWGVNEGAMTKQTIGTMEQNFRDAATRGVQIVAASGDNGADDGTGSPVTDYPASSPGVTGVGGLKMVLNPDNSIQSATAWNEGENSSTGGGISKLFSQPDWQKGIVNIKNAVTGKLGRGVPDISTNADPVTGFIVRVDGNEYVIGGTSDAAPLYAGMLLNINSELAAKGIAPVAPLNPWMYARSNDNKIFGDVTSGTNNGYSTSKGWDPVTGLGYVNGTAMRDAMIQNQTTNVNPLTNFRPNLKGLNLQNNNQQKS